MDRLLFHVALVRHAPPRHELSAEARDWTASHRDAKETVADPALTSRDSQDTSGDDMPSEVTTKDPFHEATGESVTYEYEDATHTQVLDEEEDALGPGAITAIVIAVFLGASVLLALIVITLRKFTAS
uniref:Secondary ossification center associated regulator of chondrocyte maturation n=1 Tax=Neogobius melanostomus TaxID=47308 RepID=A0A8C6TI59_9GOBI